jgi:hypothetical protein
MRKEYYKIVDAGKDGCRMKKWEYLYLTVYDNLLLDINGKDMAGDPKGKTSDFFEHLLSLGEQGWEVVGALPSMTSQYRLLLKRPNE